ncbi:hypothetical protein QBC34DRAFT_414713 [Podospora aff. communis PSN243]|uniref:Uncharacterized protein n=1 Tax=Podospora aff. communis PSN243 TaxID=3040156 RepID=A0AAV9G955_9PEZI|nr:hypothetical protein QBC34DRAFT_414713 [Podospora aff. communis PSN243]
MKASRLRTQNAIVLRQKQHLARSFSTTEIPRSSHINPNLQPSKHNENPSYPAFGLKSIVPNPKARAAVWALLGVMACVEMAMWQVFTPFFSVCLVTYADQ